MRCSEYSKAVTAFEQATAVNPKDDNVQNHRLIALYAAGDKTISEKAMGRIKQDPTDIIPRALVALQSKKHMKTFDKEIRDFVGEVNFEMIEAALVFADLGLHKEAALLLEVVCVDSLPVEKQNPLLLYYIAYFHGQGKDDASAQDTLKKATGIWRDFVFPSRPEAVSVFQYAITQNPRDACAHLHLGNLYAHLGRLDEALECWREAARLDSGQSITWRNLGLYMWGFKEDLAAAADFYRKAILARPKDQTLYRDLADILIADKKRPEAIKVLKSTPFEKVRRADIIIMLAQAYIDEERHTEAIDLLEGTPYFVNWEGQTITWDLFNRAHIARGKQRLDSGDYMRALKDFEAALTYPANIGVGRSDKPCEACAQYWRGKALYSLGRPIEANDAWKLGAEGIDGSQEQNQHIHLCREALKNNL